MLFRTVFTPSEFARVIRKQKTNLRVQKVGKYTLVINTNAKSSKSVLVPESLARTVEGHLKPNKQVGGFGKFLIFSDTDEPSESSLATADTDEVLN